MSRADARQPHCGGSFRIFMILVTVIMIYPLLWNVYSSFKTNNEFLTNAFSLPKSLAWDNYARAIEKSNLLSNVGNSVLIVLITLCVIMVCAVPCAYCLVRYKFFGSRLMLNIYMAAIFYSGNLYYDTAVFTDECIAFTQ